MDNNNEKACCLLIPTKSTVPFQSYLLGLLYCLFVISNGSQWATLSTITAQKNKLFFFQMNIQIQTAQTYSISTKIVIMSSWAFTLSNLVLGIPSNFFLSRKIRLSLQMAALIMFIGLVIRIFLEKNFYYYLAGQILISLGQPFLLNSSLALSQILFSSSNRKILATTILAISAPVGSALGMLIPPFVVTDTNVHDQLERLTISWGITGCIITFSIIVTFQLMKSRFQTQNQMLLSVKQFLIQAQKAVNKKDYILLCLFFGLAMGNLNCIGSLIQLFVSPFGYSTKESGALGAALIAAGTLASIAIGFFVSKHQYFKWYIAFLGLGHLLSFGVITIGVKIQELSVLIIGFVLAGMTTLPLMPLSFELASKIASSTSPEIVIGLLMFTSQCFTLLEIQLFLHLVAETGKNQIVIWNVVIIGITFISWGTLFLLNSKSGKESIKQINEEYEEQQSSNLINNNLENHENPIEKF